MNIISLTKYQQQKCYNFGVKKGGHPPSHSQREASTRKFASRVKGKVANTALRQCSTATYLRPTNGKLCPEIRGHTRIWFQHAKKTIQWLPAPAFHFGGLAIPFPANTRLLVGFRYPHAWSEMQLGKNIGAKWVLVTSPTALPWVRMTVLPALRLQREALQHVRWNRICYCCATLLGLFCSWMRREVLFSSHCPIPITSNF